MQTPVFLCTSFFPVDKLLYYAYNTVKTVLHE